MTLAKCLADAQQTHHVGTDAAAPGELSDLEMARLCATAMGIQFCEGCLSSDPNSLQTAHTENEVNSWYDPVNNDAQAMALVRQFKLSVGFNRGWGCVKTDERGMLLSGAYHQDTINRAIVVCVAHIPRL